MLGTTVGVQGGQDGLLPPREAVWRLTQSASGLSTFEALDGGLFLTMNGKGAKPPWMLFVVPPPSAGQEKGAKIPTSKAHISVVFLSFWLIFGRMIISRDGLEACMLGLERARAELPR